MKRINLLVICCTLSVFIINGCSSKCDSSYKKLIASLFAYAYTNPDGYIAYVQNHQNLFGRDTPLRKCLEKLYTKLMESSLSGPSSEDIRDSAYSIANRAGLPHLGDVLFADISNSELDIYSLARYLHLLDSVTIEVANGNTSAYYNSEFFVAAKRFGSIDTYLVRLMRELLNWYVLQFAKEI